MLKITVYGPGCAKCKETERRVRHVVGMAGVEAEIIKMTDPMEMARAGVLLTPAVAIEGQVKVSGRIPTEEDIRAWFSDR